MTEDNIIKLSNSDELCIRPINPNGIITIAEPIQPSFIFPFNDGSSLDISPEGVFYKGEEITDAQNVYDMLAKALNQRVNHGST